MMQVGTAAPFYQVNTLLPTGSRNQESHSHKAILESAPGDMFRDPLLSMSKSGPPLKLLVFTASL